jgi:aconitate hydratase 2/2-methylisocitrate dehydratase
VLTSPVVILHQFGTINRKRNIPRLMKFMNDFGLITDPKGEYAMTDVIHKVLNDITVDEWAIIIGGDSHTRMSSCVWCRFRYRCASTCYWRSVYANSRISKVTFKGDMKTTWISVMLFMLRNLKC